MTANGIRSGKAFMTSAALFLVACSSMSATPDERTGTQQSAVSANAEPTVTVCHRPPGDSTNGQTITVAAASLAAHVAHGDSEGACANTCVKGACCADDPDVASTCLCSCHFPGACFDGVKCGELLCSGCGALPTCPIQVFAPPGSIIDNACLPPGATCVPSGGICNAHVPCCDGTCSADINGFCP